MVNKNVKTKTAVKKPHVKPKSTGAHKVQSKDAKTEIKKSIETKSEDEITIKPTSNTSNSSTIMTVLIIALLSLVLFNQYTIGNINSAIVNPTTVSASSPQLQATGDPIQDAINFAIPTGVPGIYGTEIGVSFDDPIASLDILESYDRRALAIDFNTMTEEQKQRYIYVGQMTTCEYCCGATSNVFKDGRPACGCAHSAGMRGIAKYIITEHGAEYTDDEIIAEMNRWKALFFPKQTIQKVLAAQEETGQLDASVLNDLPGMVGGC